MNPPSFALVGVGGYGKTHYGFLKHFHDAGAIRFSAAVVLPSELAARSAEVAELTALGVQIYPSVEELTRAEKKPDLAVISTGIASHAKLTKQCLASNINVLVEKPAAATLADVDAMINSEAHSGAFAAVAFQNVYGSDIKEIKNTILSGQYGRLRDITVCGAWKRADTYYHRNQWAGKLRMPSGEAVFDSPANNAFAHYINIALFCSGEAFDVAAHAQKMQAELIRARPDIETFDTCAVRLLTDSKVSILVLLTHACDCYSGPEIRFELEGANIVWNGERWQIITKSGVVEENACADDCRKDMYQHLIRRLSEGNGWVYRLKNAREHTFCIENLHKFFAIKQLERSKFEIREDQDNQCVIPMIVEDFAKAVEKKLMPSELGFAWATESAMMNLEEPEQS